jgi:hypothetical protein
VNTIHSLADGLSIWIETELDPSRRLVFVAHSHGGIVVKEAIANRKLPVSRLAGFLFFGTPHDGSNIAGLGKLAATLLTPFGGDGAILQSVEQNSELLRQLQRRFLAVLGSDPPPIRNFYERCRTPIFRILGLSWQKEVSSSSEN